MEGINPARALAVSGVALLLLTGGSTAPLSGSTTATSGPVHASGPQSRVLAHSVSAQAHQRRTTARWSGSIKTSRRPAVDAAYRRAFAPGLDVGTGYTGDDNRCQPGTTSAESRAATLRAVNFVRSMSGLAPVRFSPTLNARSQRTALLMSANGALSHTPPHGWRCWSQAGADNAARSNLALSYPSITSAGLVDLYLRDPGSDNGPVGHRRWLLNPFSTTMGSGSTDTANAMTVIGPTDTARPNPAWVSWPTAGYFPRPLEPGGRWSLSAGNKQMDFRRATVRVYRNGVALHATKLRVANGYAQPTLVWQLPAPSTRSGTFTVVVRGAHLAGSTASIGRTYVVRLFEPTS
jgi:uncharacterized protein YkwD